MLLEAIGVPDILPVKEACILAAAVLVAWGATVARLGIDAPALEEKLPTAANVGEGSLLA